MQEGFFDLHAFYESLDDETRARYDAIRKRNLEEAEAERVAYIQQSREQDNRVRLFFCKLAIVIVALGLATGLVMNDSAIIKYAGFGAGAIFVIGLILTTDS